MKLSKILRFFYREPYEHLVQITISKDRLLENLKILNQQSVPAAVAPVLKSNAYGHGLPQVAQILKNQDLPFLVVDSLYEAQRLKQEKVSHKILVIGFTPTKNILNNFLPNVSFTVTNLEQLTELSVLAASPLKVHIKIDTGMHRQGLLPEQLPQAFKLIEGNDNLSVEGMCSHLADADGSNLSYTSGQVEAWNGAVEEFKKRFPKMKYWHLAATEGLKFSPQIQANVVRVGLGLYGISSFDAQVGLKPVLEMKTCVSSVKDLRAGESVGYNLTFTAERSMKVGVLPVGYYEGVDRRLSNQGVVKILGKFCPIIGRVSMNITTVDATDVEGLQAGEIAVILSREPGDKNCVKNLAQVCGAIPYELLVHLPASLKRTVV